MAAARSGKNVGVLPLQRYAAGGHGWQVQRSERYK
ncbi:hypothetical protein NPIL_19361, partial [Nephila pilipes]